MDSDENCPSRHCSAKRRRGKIVKMPDDAYCVICNLRFPLEFSHIIPQSLLRKFTSIDRSLFDYDGTNVVILCKNHHRMYETRCLSVEDYQKLWQYLHISIISFYRHLLSLSRTGKIDEKALDSFYEFILSFSTYHENNKH